jgi:hypothetical protein
VQFVVDPLMCGFGGVTTKATANDRADAHVGSAFFGSKNSFHN